MAIILPVKGTSEEINDTSIVDGQILFETNGSNTNSLMYMDIEVEDSGGYITDSPYYVNNTETLITIPLSTSTVQVTGYVSKKNNSEAYGAWVIYTAQGSQHITPLFVSDDVDATAYNMQIIAGGSTYDYEYVNQGITCEYNDKTWYVTSGQSLTPNTTRPTPNELQFEITDMTGNWSDYGLQFLQLIYEGNQSNSSSQSGELVPTRIPMGIYDWNKITNKPFESFGSAFTIIDGELNLSSPVTVTWNDITDKPFNTIGNGLYVANLYDNPNALCAKVQNVTFDWEGNGITYSKKQKLFITDDNGNHTTYIDGTRYIKKTQTLNTDSNTTFTFTSTDSYDIGSSSVIDVITSIPNITPIDIYISGHSCVVVFPPYNCTNTSMTCYIYIR